MPKLVVLVEERLLIGDSRLQVVDSFHVGNIGTKAGVGQRPVLTHGLLLKIGREIGKRIAARIIVVLVPPHESAEREHGVGIEQARPRRRDVEGLDLRTLVGRTNRIAVRIEAAIVDVSPTSRRSGRRRNSASGTRSG